MPWPRAASSRSVEATPDPLATASVPNTLTLVQAASLEVAAVEVRLDSTAEGLSEAEAQRRLALTGPNAVRSHHAHAPRVLLRQLRSPLLLLLLVTATLSFFVGERTDAVIIGAILAVSVGLGFVNEYRAERAAESLHSRIRHVTTVRRDGSWSSRDVTELVCGDVVRVAMGVVVPADLRLSETVGLECDESVLTGESLPVAKSPSPVEGRSGLADLASCAFMGTVVAAGEGTGIVVATGSRTEFGRIALGLGERQPETEFQLGLRGFSILLVRVAMVLTAFILAINLVLRRPLIDAVLFSLAIAVGITPQLLPAVVTTCLATGTRRLAHRGVLVKRLVAIEDLGDLELLLTDKTGTLTEGTITFQRAVDPEGNDSDRVLLLGLLCNEAVVEHGSAVGGNPLDVALWEAPAASDLPVDAHHRVALAPFDHERRMMSVLVDTPDGGRLQITKGAPESVLASCGPSPAGVAALLDGAFSSGARTVAVATRAAPGRDTVSPGDEQRMDLAGLLVFLDPPKVTAGSSLRRLQELGIAVKVVTGDNPRVAETVCAQVGVVSTGTMTGEEIAAEHDDTALGTRARESTIFARVSPEQKSRLIRVLRSPGHDVAFLGDGVNDALALHEADIGISVDTATDVAKDAADVILLAKDLDVLADGVVEGRRTFANTVKYVLMGTSSNFGNMVSAAAASAFLAFLPMLPSQILLNNLLYDAGQMTIPTDLVDEEMTRRPSHWDIGFIRQFMLVFGLISSIFDFLTFALMLWVFRAEEALFQAGWFAESLATQTLIIFVIRTRRVPFLRSRPSRPLLAATLLVVAVGAALPLSPLGSGLGFAPLPAAYFLALAGMVFAYLALVETAKRRFFPAAGEPRPRRRSRRERHTHRRAARWSHAGNRTRPRVSRPS